MNVVRKTKDYIVIGAVIGVSLITCKEAYSFGKVIGARKGFDATIKSLCDINPELAMQFAKEAVEQGKQTVTCKL